ncbi:SAM-dependent methyltransferase [Streptomyces sp. YIM 98790]|uniref:SAM-dependent methyltransferase n=1 Tax=Streptomyces sp. YIM 98790 TaxID=2689077 RepID=UPI00140D2077|nr:SAM-dependent methyltransferase [Streptomyces sp. YIM 98790]
MTDQGFSPDQIDTTRPHPARMYDYYLGGQDNYEADRIAGDRLLALTPDVRISARANRDFLARAVRHAAREGIRQFVDIGTGIPTSPNTHEVAHAVDPGARVAYVDNDPIVGVYADAKLLNTANTGFFLADLRDPEAVLEHPTLGQFVDFSRPVALMLVSVLHFITDEEDPAGILRALTGVLAPGSRLLLSHATGDFHPPEMTKAGQAVYKNATAQLTLRPHAAILRCFDGFELEEPGLVQTPLWRPDGPVGQELKGVASYAGVGVKR